MSRKITTFISIVLYNFKVFSCPVIYLILTIILESHVAIIMQILECYIPGSGLRASHGHLINYNNVLEIGIIIIPILKKYIKK